MKLVLAWLCLVALALITAGSCSVKHQSGEFECELTADCADLDGNRVCSQGFCVVPGGTQKDAAVGDGPRPDAPMLACPDACTSCNVEKKECTVDCNATPAKCPAGMMTCPTGWACLFKCNTASSCRGGINCTGSTSCDVECSGSFSCRNIACGPGPCNVECSGNNTCSGISCGQSCACDVKCGGTNTCFNVICGKAICDTGAGCSSQPVGCDTCL